MWQTPVNAFAQNWPLADEPDSVQPGGGGGGIAAGGAHAQQPPYSSPHPSTSAYPYPQYSQHQHFGSANGAGGGSHSSLSYGGGGGGDGGPQRGERQPALAHPPTSSSALAAPSAAATNHAHSAKDDDDHLRLPPVPRQLDELQDLSFAELARLEQDSDAMENFLANCSWMREVRQRTSALDRELSELDKSNKALWEQLRKARSVPPPAPPLPPYSPSSSSSPRLSSSPLPRSAPLRDELARLDARMRELEVEKRRLSFNAPEAILERLDDALADAESAAERSRDALMKRVSRRPRGGGAALSSKAGLSSSSVSGADASATSGGGGGGEGDEDELRSMMDHFVHSREQVHVLKELRDTVVIQQQNSGAGEEDVRA